MMQLLVCFYFRIITGLETLKKRLQVQKKMEETDTVIAEVDTVSQQYLPLSLHLLFGNVLHTGVTESSMWHVTVI